MSDANNIQFVLLPEDNLVIAKATGIVDFVEVLNFIDRVMADEKYIVGMKCFYDSTEVEGMAGDPMDYMKAAEMVSDELVLPKASKTSILYDRNNERTKGFTEGYLLMTTASQVEHRAFDITEMDEALKFLDLEKLPKNDLIKP